MQDPKVVISDTPPPMVVCRTKEEEAACLALLTVLRLGGTPVAFIIRKPDRTVEVHAQSRHFTSVSDAVYVMEQATAKLVAALFRRNLAARG